MPGSPKKRERREKARPIEGEVVDAAPKPARARTGLARREAEPYEPGNKAAVKHGAYSLDLVHKTAEEVWHFVEDMLAALPGWNDADQLLVAEFRITTAQLTQLRKRTAELGGSILDEENKPRAYVWFEDKLAKRWLDQAKALGLGAAERAKVFGNLGAGEKAFTEALAGQRRLQERAQQRRRSR